jgi:RNA polymerase sigma factor (sigma-70 family)
LAQLPEHESQVFVMKYLEGRDWPEIADSLEKSVSSVRSICHRALGKLETALGSISRHLSRS